MDTKLVNHLALQLCRNKDDLRQKARTRFQVLYNPAFGWHIASIYAHARLPFPITVTGRDRWLFIAYMMMLNPELHANRNVEDALQIYRKPGASAKLKALLIAGLDEPVDAHLSLVAEKTGFSKHTVEAFSALFFDVLDRAKEHLYLSHVVYPAGRAVEIKDDYFESTAVETLLLRAAYNHRDIDLVLRLSGMAEAAFKKEILALHESQSEFSSRIIGNALLMAKMGLLNQRSEALDRATALLAAGRQQPGNISEADAQEFHDLAAELAAALAAMPPLTDEQRQELEAAAHPGASYWHDEEGNIMPVDPEELFPNLSQPETHTIPGVKFPKPINGIWRNKDSDKPVVIAGMMSETGLPDHFLTIDGSGIPASEVFFDN